MSRYASRMVRRAPILIAVVATLIVGGLVDRAGAAKLPSSAELVQIAPRAAPADALSSSWFCAGAADNGSVQASGQVVIANDGPEAIAGSVTVVPSRGAPVKVSVHVAAHGSASVPETVPGGSPWVGAIVDVDAGAVAVVQTLQGLTTSVSPCATSGSPAWYFATGQTRINADTVIHLLNPYPSDSIVDLTFTTDQGIEQPQDFQGIDVPAGRLVSLDLRSNLRRRASIATTVKARTGRIVAWETEWVTPPAAGQAVVGTPQANAALADPASPVPGVGAILGAPATATSWVWPDGLAGANLDEQYVIYNPTGQTAKVRLSVGLQQGQAEPFDLSVGPYQVTPIVSEHEARIPSGVPHSATLTSLNGVGVVATRSLTAAGAPMAGGELRTGITRIPGALLRSERWIVPAPSTGANLQGWVVVQNPTDQNVRVDFGRLSPTGEAPLGAGADETVVAPEGRVSVAVPAREKAPVTVDATGPIYVEYDLYGSPGISASLAVPLG